MQRKFLFATILIAAASVLTFAFADDTFQGVVVKQPFDRTTHGPAAKTTSTQIIFHQPPVMNVSNSVYAIYYGTFPTTTPPIMNDFLAGLSASTPQIYGVNTTYNNGGSTPAIPATFSFNPTPAYVYLDQTDSQGTQLGTNTIPKIVANAINHGLAADPNGIYLVMTGPEIKVSGFCSSFCAYHTKSDITLSNGNKLHIRYALIPDPSQKCTACNGGIAVYGDTATPNGDMGADTMADDIIHELSETVTDPDISAWYTQNGAENGDLCNYNYGDASVGVLGTGIFHSNVTVPTASGSRQFLIQQIWKNNGSQPGACASSPN